MVSSAAQHSLPKGKAGGINLFHKSTMFKHPILIQVLRRSGLDMIENLNLGYSKLKTLWQTYSNLPAVKQSKTNLWWVLTCLSEFVIFLHVINFCLQHSMMVKQSAVKLRHPCNKHENTVTHFCGGIGKVWMPLLPDTNGNRETCWKLDWKLVTKNFFPSNTI